MVGGRFGTIPVTHTTSLAQVRGQKPPLLPLVYRRGEHRRARWLARRRPTRRRVAPVVGSVEPVGNPPGDVSGPNARWRRKPCFWRVGPWPTELVSGAQHPFFDRILHLSTVGKVAVGVLFNNLCPFCLSDVSSWPSRSGHDGPGVRLVLARIRCFAEKGSGVMDNLFATDWITIHTSY